MESINLLLIGNSMIQDWETVFPNSSFPLHVINLGKSGLITTQMLYLDIVDYDPNVVIYYCDSIEETIEDTEKVLEKIQEHYPNALVVYLSILKSSGRSFFYSQIDKINHSIRNFSKKARSEKGSPSRIQFIDLNQILCARSEYFEEDGIHLNSLGYEKINENVFKQIFE